MNINELNNLAKQMRKDALDMALASGTGGSHLGGSLSCIEILAVLYGEILHYDVKNPEWDERDYFLPSKNHCTLAHFPALAYAGFIDRKELPKFKEDGGRLTGYPRNVQIGLEYSGGSLGMALPVALGIAYHKKQINSKSKIYVLVGDGELNEGSIWEAVLAASQFKLDNLILIIDRNHLSYDGDTEDIMALDSLQDKFESFHWETTECDGHCVQELCDCFRQETLNKPKVIIAHTVKGKGVSFIENKREWHHAVLSKTQYEQAMQELSEV